MPARFALAFIERVRYPLAAQQALAYRVDSSHRVPPWCADLALPIRAFTIVAVLDRIKATLKAG